MTTLLRALAVIAWLFVITWVMITPNHSEVIYQGNTISAPDYALSVGKGSTVSADVTLTLILLPAETTDESFDTTEDGIDTQNEISY